MSDLVASTGSEALANWGQPTWYSQVKSSVMVIWANGNRNLLFLRPSGRPVLQVWDDCLWVIGGDRRATHSKVLRSPYGPDGRLGRWEEVEGVLPEPVSHAAVARAGGRILLLGGLSSGSSRKPLSEVYCLTPV